MFFLIQTDIEITIKVVFLHQQTIEEEHLADFPREHLSQALTETFPPRGDLTTATSEGEVSISSSIKGDQ